MSRLLETFKVGALDVAALSDGAPDRALGGFFNGIDPELWMPAIGVTEPEQAVPFNFGTFLVRGEGRTVLIDSGYGPPAAAMGVPGGGEMLARLAELGVTPGEVETVVHTHLHLDHCGWDVDEAGEVVFRNARVLVAAAEIAFWTSAAADGLQQAEGARRVVDALKKAGRVDTFEGEHAVAPWLTTVPTPGHTPGHTSMLLTSGSEHLIVVGDAAHHPAHFEHHDWLPGVDISPADSTASRGKLAALAADRDALVTGGHFPILTLGRVRRVEGGYRWESA